MPRPSCISLFFLCLILSVQVAAQKNRIVPFDLEYKPAIHFFQEGTPANIYYDPVLNENNIGGQLEAEQSIWWKRPVFLGFAINASFVLIYAFYYFSVKQIRMEERLKAEFDKKLSNVEMTALRSQMNPHFIFNCLNSIDY